MHERVHIGTLTSAASEAAARNGPAEEPGHRGADVDVDRLVVRAEGVGKIAEGLAVVHDGLAAEHEREHALLLVAVGLGAEGGEHGAIVDGGAHGKLVLAGEEEDVVDVNGADVLSEEVVEESGVTLRRCQWEGEVWRRKFAYNVQREHGVVGNMGGALEVVAASVGLESDVGVGDGGAVESTETFKTSATSTEAGACCSLHEKVTYREW